jgi:RHS repeat-associated protein
MTRYFSPNDNNDDLTVVAVKASPVSGTTGSATTTAYAYPQTGYMNPDAVGTIGNGFSTTTYSYDANGNLIQAGGWSYMWDYLNRMLASSYSNSTTTYAYDATGARVLQTSTTSTTYYPSKYYSFTSTKSGANTYATSTNYVFNGDTLLATIDQALYNGAATGSPITRYIHPDHLGSTNAVTDQSGNLVQLMDYYPYGATRIATSTYPTNEKRRYIGQYSDAQTNLDYFNARYYDGQRGQFISQDPVFQGNPKDQDIRNPQSLNSYNYANDNPITNKDPSGNFTLTIPLAIVVALLVVVLQMLSNPQITHNIQSAIYNAPAPSAIVQPLPEKQQPPIQGLPIFPQSIPQSKPVSTIPIGPAASTPYTITPTNFSNAAPSINFAQSGKTTIIEKPGDINTAENEFLNLNPVNIKTDPKNGTIYGNLPDGGTANVRPQSTDGRPTLEIQHPNGDTTKIRYGDK